MLSLENEKRNLGVSVSPDRRFDQQILMNSFLFEVVDVVDGEVPLPDIT